MLNFRNNFSLMNNRFDSIFCSATYVVLFQVAERYVFVFCAVFAANIAAMYVRFVSYVLTI